MSISVFYILSLQYGVTFDAGWSKYTSYGSDARDSIIANFGWIILDGGFTTITPLPPESPLATFDGSFMNLTWSAPLSDGGSSIFQYRIYRSNISNTDFSFIRFVTQNSFIDNKIVHGQAYYNYITAVNNLGEGLASIEVNIFIPITTPSFPESVYTSVSESHVNPSWSPPISDGGSTITQYLIYRSNSSNSGYCLISSVLDTLNRYSDTNVTVGQTYYYVITAENSMGEAQLQ